MKVNKIKNKEIHYKDEYNDDFGNIDLKEYEVSDNFSYPRKGFLKYFSSIFYWGILFPFLNIYLFFNGTRVKNRHYIKEYYKLCKENNSGGFLYSNHTANQDAFDKQCLVLRKRRANIIANTSILSSKFLTFITLSGGYLPLSKSIKGQANMLKGLEYYLKERKQDIIIYPEAHIWPYYTKIRPLKSATFHYPAKFLTPILPVVTTYKKRKLFKKPKRIIIVCKPIMPLKDKDIKDNKIYLKDLCEKEMIEASNSMSQYEYIKYIKDNE